MFDEGGDLYTGVSADTRASSLLPFSSRVASITCFDRIVNINRPNLLPESLIVVHDCHQYFVRFFTVASMVWNELLSKMSSFLKCAAHRRLLKLCLFKSMHVATRYDTIYTDP